MSSQTGQRHVCFQRKTDLAKVLRCVIGGRVHLNHTGEYIHPNHTTTSVRLDTEDVKLQSQVQSLRALHEPCESSEDGTPMMEMG